MNILESSAATSGANSANRPRTLLFTGVSDGNWKPWAYPCTSTFEGTEWQAVVVSWDWAIERAKHDDDVLVVGWIEAPDRYLAYQLAQATDLKEALASWANQSAALVRAAHVAPKRWILLDADEAVSAQANLRDFLSVWLHSSATIAILDAVAATEPGSSVQRLVAREWLKTEPRWTERYAEFSAACTVLDEGFAAHEVRPGPPALVEDLQVFLAARRDEQKKFLELTVALSQAEDRYRKERGASANFQVRAENAERHVALGLENLHAAQEEIERLHLLIAECQASSTNDSTSLKDAQSRTDEAEVARAAAEIGRLNAESQASVVKARADVAETKAAALQKRVTELQNHLQAANLDGDRMRTRVSELEPAANASASLRGRLDELERERDLLRSRMDHIEQLRVTEHSERQAIERRFATLQKDSDRLRFEGTDLLSRLHECQEFVERLSLEHQVAREIRVLEQVTGLLLPICGTTRCLASHETGLHRHADFEIADLRWGDRESALFDVRLVDHRGRAGLLFWGQPNSNRCVSAWAPNGEEGGRPFMLLVPDDPTSRRHIDNFGTSDWLLLQCVARRLFVACRMDPELTRWAPAASRLCRQLTGLEPRLRYDAVDVKASPDTLTLRAANAHFDDHELGEVHLVWSRSARQLTWICPRDELKLPLGIWPLVESGRPQERCSLPVGASFSTPAWLEMPSADQLLVLGALDLLNGAVGRLPAGPEQFQTAKDVRKLRNQTHSALRRLRARSIVRRLVQRGDQDR